MNTCWWTPSSRTSNTGRLLNAEVEYLLLCLNGSLDGSEHRGKKFNYVCTSTTAESADGRAQHATRAATRPNQGRVPASQQRVMGLQSHGIDQPLESSINLPSDMLSVGITSQRGPCGLITLFTSVLKDKTSIKCPAGREGGQEAAAGGIHTIDYLYWFTITH